MIFQHVQSSTRQDTFCYTSYHMASLLLPSPVFSSEAYFVWWVRFVDLPFSATIGFLVIMWSPVQSDYGTSLLLGDLQFSVTIRSLILIRVLPFLALIRFVDLPFSATIGFLVISPVQSSAAQLGDGSSSFQRSSSRTKQERMS